METRIITDKQKWEDFLAEFKPHSFLQTWEWGETQKFLGHKIFRYGLYDLGLLIGVFFAYKVEAKRGSFVFCPHGPLIDWRNMASADAIIGKIIEIGREEKADFVRISCLAENNVINQKYFKEKNFLNASVHMMHPELAWLLDISKSEEELLSDMKKRTRYSIKKAVKEGVKIVKGPLLEDLENFWEIYLETAARQGFVPFSKDYLAREFDIFSKSGKIMIFSAYSKERLLASAMIVFANGSAFYHHGASRRDDTGVPAAELLQWEAIKEARASGCKTYNFWGIAPEGESKHPWAGLSVFKKGFGGYPESYLHAQDLPLTKKVLDKLCD